MSFLMPFLFLDLRTDVVFVGLMSFLMLKIRTMLAECRFDAKDNVFVGLIN